MNLWPNGPSNTDKRLRTTNMGSVHKALIVGGGIAGLSTAIGLRKAGVEAEIVEIKKEWMTYHVGIIVFANFIRAMVTLGIADRCVAAGFPYENLRFYDSQGKFLSAVGGAKLAGPHYPANLGLTRPALHRVLTDTAAQLGTPIFMGVTISEIKEFPDRISVKLSNGAERDYDLVIGADGVNSKVRSLLFGDKYKPTFTGQGTWRCQIPRPEGLDHALIYDGREMGKAGVVPLTEETAYIFKVAAEPGNPHFSNQGLAPLLISRLVCFGGIIAEIRDRHIHNNSQIVYRPLEALIVPNPWYRGRVLLIGDAAHTTPPQLGQGAAQAVEDAVVLAELASSAESIPKILETFMRRRYERNKFVVEASVQIGEWEQHPTPDADFIGLTAKSLDVISAPI